MQLLFRNLIISLNLWTLPIVIVSIILVALSLGAQPAYRAFKEWRSDRILATSEEFFEEESYLQAFQKAQAATLLSPGNLEANRHLATMAVQFRHPQAHRFWLTVLRHEEVQNSDWMHAVDAAIQSGKLEIAFDYLRDWEASGGGEELEFFVRKAMAYAQSSEFATAISFLEEAQEKFPGSEEPITLFRSIAQAIGSPQLLQHAADKMLAKNDPSLAELRWIAFNKSLNVESRLKAIEMSRQSPELSMEHEILFLGLAMRIGGEAMGSEFDNFRSRIDLGDTSQIRAYTSILSDQGRHEEVLEILGVDPRTSDRFLLRNQLLAFLETGELDLALEQEGNTGEDWPTTIAEESIIRALAFREYGNERQFQESLRRAIESAAQSDFDFVEQRVASLGEAAYLVSLYKEVAAKTQPSPDFLFRWLETAVAVGSKAEVEAALSKIQTLPGSQLTPQQRSLAAYFAILFGLEMENAKGSAERLAAQFPEEAFFKYLLGFAYQRIGLADLAKSAIAGVTPQAGDRRSQFIAAVISGDQSQIDPQNLLTAERALLTK